MKVTLSRAFSLMAAAAATVTLASCATEAPEAPEGGVRIDQQNSVRPALNSVRVIDEGLARYVGPNNKVLSALDVEGVYVSPTATGFNKITAQIRNRTDVMIPLEVRVSWFDANGVPSDASASWTRLYAQPQAMVTFEQSSIRMNSVQYYVEIRRAQ